MLRLVLALLLSAAPAFAGTKAVCHICKCGSAVCDNLCYHQHDTSHRDYECRMACHCRNAVAGHKSCDRPPRRKAAVAGRSADLTTAYDAFNFLYFAGKLPHVSVQVTDGPNDGNLGVTTFCGDRCANIVISTYWAPAEVTQLETLLHEQCHIETQGELEKHGPRWQACMHRLADHGAFSLLW